MARPARTPINALITGWVGRLNGNFQQFLEYPFPMYMAADITALNAKTASLYAGCLAIVQTDKRMYISNGSTWALYDKKLAYIAPLDTGTATITTIKNAYNSLLADMQSKGLMA